MTEDQIKHMVDRFLGWRLPEDFHPDNGISFDPTFNKHLPVPTKCNPVGTNLFTAAQADAMIRHLLDGLPLAQANENAALEIEAAETRAEAAESAVKAMKTALSECSETLSEAQRLLRIAAERIATISVNTFSEGRT